MQTCLDTERTLLQGAYARKPLNLHLTVAVAAVGGGLLYAFVFRDTAMLWWVLAIGMGTGAGYLECRWFERMQLAQQPLSGEQVRLGKRVFAAQSTLGGLVWGLGPAWLFFEFTAHAADHNAHHGEEMALLVATLVCVGAVAMGSLAEQMGALRGFLLAQMLPPASVLLLTGDSVAQMVGLALLAGMTIMVVVAQQSHAGMRQLIEAEQRLKASVELATLAQARAEEAGAAKAQFLANMSHEIRTPLNGVLGMMDLMRTTPLSPQQLDYNAKGQVAARALLRLVDNVLDFSKIDAGRLDLYLQPLPLHTLLRESIDILVPVIGSKPVALQLDLDPRVPEVVLGDGLRLQQVVLNLAGNAVKFTTQGDVRLEVALVSASTQFVRVKFAIHDTGIGIAAADQARVFDGFSQAEASTTRRFGGTGLGLSISKQLVELMGGQLGLTSELGKGSCFSFELDFDLDPSIGSDFSNSAHTPPPTPALALPPPTPALSLPPRGIDPTLAKVPASRPKRLDRMRLLLVEDNLINQQIARELLKSEGAVVAVAADGQLAVDAVSALQADGAPPFHAILMDLQMPVMDGFEATRAIRALQSQVPGQQPTPIIAMTANAMEKDRQACKDAGMNEHVGKPFNLGKLVDVLLRHAQT